MCSHAIFSTPQIIHINDKSQLLHLTLMAITIEKAFFIKERYDWKYLLNK